MAANALDGSASLDEYDLAMISYLACPESYETAPVRASQVAKTLSVIELAADATRPADSTPPTVVDIIASGSLWGPSFIDAVDGGNSNGLGYSLNAGEILPNAGIDRFYIQFSEPVVGFEAPNIVLLGSDPAVDYSIISSLSYDSGNMRGLVQLSRSISRDKLRIGLSDSITDGNQTKLDGDQDGNAGGSFDLRFNILVGDSNGNGSVNGGDLTIFGRALNKTSGEDGYDPLADWNADGVVSSEPDNDLGLFKAGFNRSLPAREPSPLGFPLG